MLPAGLAAARPRVRNTRNTRRRPRGTLLQLGEAPVFIGRSYWAKPLLLSGRDPKVKVNHTGRRGANRNCVHPRRGSPGQRAASRFSRAVCFNWRRNRAKWAGLSNRNINRAAIP